MLENFNQTHAETDYLISYPDETGFTVEQESEFMQKKYDSDNEIEIIAEVDGKVVATSGISAKEAAYKQLELEAVADNERAIALYEKMGFVEFGRNPKGFISRIRGYQKVVYMRLDLE